MFLRFFMVIGSVVTFAYAVQGTRTGHVREKLLGSGVNFGMNIRGIEVK